MPDEEDKFRNLKRPAGFEISKDPPSEIEKSPGTERNSTRADQPDPRATASPVELSNPSFPASKIKITPSDWAGKAIYIGDTTPNLSEILHRMPGPSLPTVDSVSDRLSFSGATVPTDSVREIAISSRNGESCCEITEFALAGELDLQLLVTVTGENGRVIDRPLPPGGGLTIKQNLGRCFRLTVKSTDPAAERLFGFDKVICCKDLQLGRVVLRPGLFITGFKSRPCEEFTTGKDETVAKPPIGESLKPLAEIPPIQEEIPEERPDFDDGEEEGPTYGKTTTGEEENDGSDGDGSEEIPPDEEITEIPPEEVPKGKPICDILRIPIEGVPPYPTDFVSAGGGGGGGQEQLLLVMPILAEPFEPARTQQPPRNEAYVGLDAHLDEPTELNENRYEGNFGVHLADGASTGQCMDLSVRSVAFDFEFRRFYNSNVVYDGPLGYGWEFDYNRRLLEIPVKGRRLDQDRFVEDLPFDSSGKPVSSYAKLTSGGLSVFNLKYGNDVYHFDGQCHRYLFQFLTAAYRKCRLTPDGNEFDAFVNTYASPPGLFVQLYRFVILGGINPFIPSPVFYMLRHKEGKIEIYDCEGLLRKLIDRNGNFMEFRHNGIFNPKTKRRVLSEIIDTAGRRYAVKQTLQRGSPVPRIESITVKARDSTDRTRFKEKTLRFSYKRHGKTHLLEQVILPGNARVRYQYQGKKIHTVTDPREVAAHGGSVVPWLTYHYRGDKVGNLSYGFDLNYQIQYADPTVSVFDANRNRTRYNVKKTDDTAVVSTIEVFDEENPATVYKTEFRDYNTDYQPGEIKLPGGDRFVLNYEARNEVLYAGMPGAERADIRENALTGIVRYNDLAKGNLLNTTHYPAANGKGKSPIPLSTSREYEPLFNQITKITDARKQETIFEFPINGAFPAWHLNGNPIAIRHPDLTPAEGDVLTDIFDGLNYDRFGLLHARGDPLTHITVIRRHELTGRPKEIQHPNGDIEEYTYDYWGNKLTSKDPRKVVTKWDHDPRDRVETEIRDFGNTPSNLNIKSIYQWDENDNLIRLTEEWKDNFKLTDHGALKHLPEQANESVQRFNYDLLNRIKDQYIRETSGDFEELHTRLLYHHEDNGKRRVSIDKPMRVESRLAGTTRYLYNERNLLKQVIRGSGKVISTTSYGYDDNGNRIWEEDGRKHVTCFCFDGFNRQVGYQDPAGNRLELILDEAGNVLRNRFYGHTGGPTPTLDRKQQQHLCDRKSKNGNGPSTASHASSDVILLRDTEFEYDEHGNLRKQMEYVWRAEKNPNAEAHVLTTKYLYDKDDRLECVVDTHGNRTEYEYDARHRLTKETDALRNFVKWVPDGNGNIVEEHHFERASEVYIDPVRGGKTHITKRIYDHLNTLTAETDPLGYTTRFLRDSRGNVRAQIDRRDYAMLYAWDVLGRMTKQLVEWGQPTINKREMLTTRYQYQFKDGSGEITMTSPLGVTRHHYDVLGRLTKTVLPDGTTSEVLEYDANDNPVCTKDANGTVLTNIYDVLDRLVIRKIEPGKKSNKVPNLSVGGVRKEFYEHDGLGRITATAGDGCVLFRYDSLGRKISELQCLDYKKPLVYDQYGEPQSPGQASIVRQVYGRPTSQRIEPNGEVKDVTTTYGDSNHRRIVQTYPSKMPRDPAQAPFQIEQDFDELERIKSIVMGFGENSPDGKISYRYIGREDRVAVRTYSDLRTDATTGNSTETQYCYDLGRRLDGITHTAPSGPNHRAPPFPQQGNPVMRIGNLAKVFDQAQSTDRKVFAAYRAQQRDEEGNLIEEQSVLPESQRRGGGAHSEIYACDYDSLNRIVKDVRIFKAVQKTLSLNELLKLLTSTTLATLDTVSSVEQRFKRLVKEQSVQLQEYVQRHKYLSSGVRDVTQRVQHDTFPGQNSFRRNTTINRNPVPGTLNYNSIKVDVKEYRERKIPIEQIFPVGFVANWLLAGKPPPSIPLPEAETSVPTKEYKNEYDNIGNRIKDTNNLYTYDYRNRLVKAIENPDSGTYYTEYRYDAWDRLIWREERMERRIGILDWRVETIRTWFIYSGDHCIEELELKGEGRMLAAKGNTRYIWGARPDELVRMDRLRDIFPASNSPRSYYIHEDMDGRPEFFCRFSSKGTSVEESSMIQIGGHFFPSIADHTVMPFPAMAARYDGFFEGHLINGKPLFNLEQPVNFVSRRQEQFRAELARNRYQMDSWVLNRLQSGPFGALVYWVGALGLIATGNTSLEEEMWLESASGVADLFGPPGPFDVLPGVSELDSALMHTASLDDEHFCFLAGTLVETENGRKPIEDIAVGDRVLSRDERTGEQGYQSVVRLFRNRTEEIVSVTIEALADTTGAQTIHCTPGHPWYIHGRGWTDAAELRLGDRFISACEEPLVVGLVKAGDDHAETFNFEVEYWHTYFVAGGGDRPSVWVHNQSRRTTFVSGRTVRGAAASLQSLIRAAPNRRGPKSFRSWTEYHRYMEHRLRSMARSRRGHAAHTSKSILSSGFVPPSRTGRRHTVGKRAFEPDADTKIHFGPSSVRLEPHFYERKTSGRYYWSGRHTKKRSNIVLALVEARRRRMPFTLDLRGTAHISGPLRRRIERHQSRYGGEIL